MTSAVGATRQITVTVPRRRAALRRPAAGAVLRRLDRAVRQLVITAGNGKQSIDTVTVTIGGKAPTHVAASASIQAAIDAAAPGDLIMIDPTCTATAGQCCTPARSDHDHHDRTGAYNEMLLMWKPVRLQGVGAASSIINANTHPAGKLDPWRQQVNCLFGLAPQRHADRRPAMTTILAGNAVRSDAGC